MALIEIDWRPPPRQLRQFSAILLGFAPILFLVLRFKFGVSPTVAGTVGAATAAVALFGLALPRAIRPLFVVLMAISLPIGLVVSTVLLLAIYFLVTTPMGLVGRLFGYDPLRRRLDPSASTYWVERSPVTDVRRYFRQH